MKIILLEIFLRSTVITTLSPCFDLRSSIFLTLFLCSPFVSFNRIPSIRYIDIENNIRYYTYPRVFFEDFEKLIFIIDVLRDLREIFIEFA